jgi:hypothetical protein
MSYKIICFLIGLHESCGKKSVWIIGSSIIKHAFTYARTTYDGISLGLNRRNCSIWWQGNGGMHWDELVPRIKYLLKIERAPDMLIVHCGGNNLGYHHLHKLRLQIKASLNRVQKMLPNVKIIWSQILPRLSWRSSKNTQPCSCQN